MVLGNIPGMTPKCCSSIKPKPLAKMVASACLSVLNVNAFMIRNTGDVRYTTALQNL